MKYIFRLLQLFIIPINNSTQNQKYDICSFADKPSAIAKNEKLATVC